MEPGLFWLIMLILAAVFACLGTYAAVQNYRSMTEGFLLGFLFGPLGVLLVAILPTGGAARAPRTSGGSPLTADRPPPLKVDLDNLAAPEPKPKPREEMPLRITKRPKGP